MLSKSLYLCTNCRKKIEHSHQILFVDQSKNAGYCSEDCILEFLTPLMESFENEEIVKRDELGLNFSEGFEDIFQDQNLFHQVLYNPDDIRKHTNQLGHEFYTHFKFNEDIEATFIIITSYYNNEPSFVYFKTITKSKDLIKLYAKDSVNIEKIEKEEVFEIEDELQDQVSLPKDLLEDIEMKKSEYLAKLLESRDEEDVPFEKFPEYDDYLPLALEEPDEIFEQNDEAGDDIKVFIKSFKINSNTFFYIVLCVEIDIPEADGQRAILPILGFPSQDSNLYKEYATGNRITEMTKN